MTKLHLLHLAGVVAVVVAFTIGARSGSNRSQSTANEILYRPEIAPFHLGFEGDQATTPDRKEKPAPDEATEAIDAAFSTRDYTERVRRIALLLRDITPENAPSILQAIDSHDGREDIKDYLRLLASAWGKVDGARALETAEALSDYHPFRAHLSLIVEEWVNADAEAAIAWISDFEEEVDVTGRNDLSNLLVNLLVPTNREGATDYILSLSDGAKQRDLIPIVADSIYEEKGIDGSKEWIGSLPTSDLRQAALATVARNHSWVDLEESIQLVSENGGDEKAFEAVGEGAYIHAVRHFDEHEDVNQSFKYIETLPEGVIRSRGYEGLFHSWAKADAESASAYLRDMAAGGERDYAVVGFTSEISKEDPAMALEWASTITDESMRNKAIDSGIVTWHNQDPDAAWGWVDTAELSPELREQLQRFRRW